MYIDRAYIESFLSPARVTQLLSVGDTPVSSGSVYLDNMISASCSHFDAAALMGGVANVPLDNPPAMVKSVCAWIVIEQLFVRATKPVPQQMQFEINGSRTFLANLANGAVQIPGVPLDPSTGPGGHWFTANNSSLSSSLGRLFDRGALDFWR